MNNIFSYFSLSKTEKKAFVNIFLTSLLAMSSLLLANILYSDDITRVTTGETLWNDNGRPLSSLISILLQLGKPLTDISPLPQILAFAIYALSAIYLGKLFKVNNLLLLTLSGIIFVINPFNLQNFAFIFDSFPMAVAILTSILAAISICIGVSETFKSQEKIFAFIFSIVLLLCSLCLYQSGTSVYLVVCSFYALVKLLEQAINKTFQILIASITTFLCALIAYIPIKEFYVSNEYSLHHSEIISFSEFPQKVLKTLLRYWNNIDKFLGDSFLLILFYSLFAITIVTIVVSAITILKKTIANPGSKSLLQYLLFFSLIACSILLLFITPSGLMLFLKNPIFAPRTMMGFSALVAVCCLFLSHQFSQKKKSNFLKYCLIAFLAILSLAFGNVSSTLGNVLYAQNVQEEVIATILVSDLGEVAPEILRYQPKLAIINALDYSYGNTKAYEKYPLLTYIVWHNMVGNRIHFYGKLETLGFKFGGVDYKKDVFTGENNKFIPKTEPVLIRPLYKMYLENQDLLVVVLQNPQNQ